MKKSGFSLVELIIVVVIVGILASLVWSVALNMIEESKKSTAIANAQATNTAKQAYRNRVPSADSDPTWTSGTDTAKFNLLITAGYMPYVTDITSYMPSGYVLSVGDFVNSAQVTKSDGTHIWP